MRSRYVICGTLVSAMPNGHVQQPVHSVPSVFPAKSTSGKSQLHSKHSLNGPFPENFLTNGGYFECHMYHVTVLGWPKKEEEEEEEEERR